MCLSNDMMRFRDFENRNNRGQQRPKAFGFLRGQLTHGPFSAHIPLHIVEGAANGPVLLVQAGVSDLR